MVDCQRLAPIIADAVAMVLLSAKEMFPDKGRDAEDVALAMLIRAARIAEQSTDRE